MKPASGVLVTRNVKLLRPLRSGGMGSVWVAMHTTLDTEVAVKFIAPEHVEKERFVARFRREASSAAKIKSPHVVQVFDHGVTDGGVPYIVMELLEGEPLSRRLRRGPLGARETAIMVSQVAKVLTTAHDLGIVHRDLKPDNLFLVDSGYELFVKVLDFGIAKQMAGEPSEITDTGAMVGTPYFMSPEMLLSPKDADHRADLWALGVVAYHALTGVLPFRGETLAALSVAINDGAFKPPSALEPMLGPEVDAWCKLALCRSLAGRFSSAVELAQGLRQAVQTSGEITGDRTSRPVGANELPESSRPPGAPAMGAEEAPTEPASTTEPSAKDDISLGDPTITSEQLVEIHRDAQLAVVEAPLTTLAGTASDDSGHPPSWGRWAAIGALLLVAGVGVAFAVRDDPSPPALATSATTPPSTVETTAAPRSVEPVPSAKPVPAPSSTVSASAAPARIDRPPAPRRLPPVLPKPEPACDNPFMVDENGDLQPRPGCF